MTEEKRATSTLTVGKKHEKEERTEERKRRDEKTREKEERKRREERAERRELTETRRRAGRIPTGFPRNAGANVTGNALL